MKIPFYNRHANLFSFLRTPLFEGRTMKPPRNRTSLFLLVFLFFSFVFSLCSAEMSADEAALRNTVKRLCEMNKDGSFGQCCSRDPPEKWKIEPFFNEEDEVPPFVSLCFVNVYISSGGSGQQGQANKPFISSLFVILTLFLSSSPFFFSEAFRIKA